MKETKFNTDEQKVIRYHAATLRKLLSKSSCDVDFDVISQKTEKVLQNLWNELDHWNYGW